MAWLVIPVIAGVAITVLFLNWLCRRLAQALNDRTRGFFSSLFKRR
jgi:ABC-type dipeptide/oligopeptide/nickel transport system permease subunit